MATGGKKLGKGSTKEIHNNLAANLELNLKKAELIIDIPKKFPR